MSWSGLGASGTHRILEIGYRWVPGTGQKKKFGYRWVPGTGKISLMPTPVIESIELGR